MGAAADHLEHDAEITAHAEQAIIGGLLVCNDAYDDIAGQLAPSHFADHANGLLYAGIARLLDAGRGADAITLGEHLEARGELDRAGGLAYLAAISNNIPSAANLRRYADIVIQRATVRGGLRAAAHLIDNLMGAGKQAPAEALLDAAAELEALTQQGASDDIMTCSSQQLLERALRRLDRRYTEGEAASNRVPSGLKGLDAKLAGGGFGRGELIVIAGRPGSGKSVLKSIIADAISMIGHRNGGHVLRFELEMSEEQDSDRQLAAHSGVELSKLQAAELDDTDWARLTVATKTINNLQQTIDYRPGLTLAQVRAKARKVKRKQGHLAAIVVDYLQLMRSPGAENRTQEISQISAGLKALAKEMDCPVFALSQLSRGVEQRADKRPLMSDLRESGAIEQDADTILLIYRDEQYNPDSAERGVIEIIIGKQRQGRANETVRAQWDGACSRVRDLAADWRPAEPRAQKPKFRSHEDHDL
ncbi:replicative DNA helicase [Chitinimonas lacunae]|uniref:Replicative DNA helicase n=1 Tax=Chitinimonas lacunae TaxID=1963018 RepID=A0ABV8MLV0_9NEIS